MKRIFNNLIRKKNKGQSDLICSLFVVMTLIVILFLSVGVVKDISKVTFVDQVARQGIIKLEIQGKISDAERENIKTKLTNADLIFDNSHTLSVNGTNVSDGVYVAYKNSSGEWIIDTSNNHNFKYGEEIGIYIQCQAKTFKFNGNIFGTSDSSRYTTITRIKSSITKRAN